MGQYGLNENTLESKVGALEGVISATKTRRTGGWEVHSHFLVKLHTKFNHTLKPFLVYCKKSLP